MADPVSPEYSFREATRSDIPAMKQIRDHVRENALASGFVIGETDYEQALFRDGKGWVCLRGHEIVGFSCGRTTYKDVWALFLHEDHECKGIGNKLMEMLENWMFSQGCGEIVLSTTPGTRAERLYRRRGWAFSGFRSNGEVEFRLRKNS
jgi:GNAT superfamily N-acetyltransferase